MVKPYRLSRKLDAKLYMKYSLAFFLCICLSNCKQKADAIKLIWKDQFAIGIVIPKSLLKDTQKLKIVQANSVTQQQILGDFSITNDVIVFKPLIPFTAGLAYQIWENKSLIGAINIDIPKNLKQPVLLSIYPNRDTVPENLLKFYFHFSRPMRSGNALNYIHLLDKKGDTLHNIFLDLQPELWDSTGTILTVWIDPGRIKRELVLHKKLGIPLRSEENYQLVVAQSWKDKYGLNLAKKYVKNFVAATNDGEKPKVEIWQLQIPKAHTKAALIINAKEALDHYLFKETISVISASGEIVEGKITVENGQIYKFIPNKMWQLQTYQLRVNTKLEDLAANNLNKVFDRDISRDSNKDEVYVFRSFQVKP